MGAVLFFILMLLAAFLALTGTVAAISAVTIRLMFPALSAQRATMFAAAFMPAISVAIAIVAANVGIGVEDNGPQIMGGIVLFVVAIGIALAGLPIGRFSARWALHRFSKQ